MNYYKIIKQIFDNKAINIIEENDFYLVVNIKFLESEALCKFKFNNANNYQKKVLTKCHKNYSDSFLELLRDIYKEESKRLFSLSLSAMLIEKTEPEVKKIKI